MYPCPLSWVAIGHLVQELNVDTVSISVEGRVSHFFSNLDLVQKLWNLKFEKCTFFAFSKSI